MRNLLLAAAALGAIIATQPSPAEARDLPFCMITPNTTDRGDCSFYTYAQCMATVSGQKGYCDRNYFLGAYDDYQPAPYPYRARRAYRY